MRLKFLSNIVDYFSFNKSQQAGLIIMFVLIILILLANLFVPYFVKDELFQDDDFLKEIEEFRKASVKNKEDAGISDPFPFDPNLISHETMLELGLTEYQAKMIGKYRDAGGRFYHKEDFKKIYSITEKDFEVLKPYIIIAKPEVKTKKSEKHHKIRPKPFNPNEADSLLLSEIGLAQRQISQILNYRKAGGTFRIKSDFKKIYSISDKDYDILQKYILLPSVIDSVVWDNKVVNKESIQKEKRPMVEINLADTTELEKLFGIGPYYAKKIIEYREKLGGFYDKSQLLEVFGIDSSRYFKFENQVLVDKGLIKKININQVRFNEMLKHPYFEYYMVKAIFNLKDATGVFYDISELRQIDLLYDELFEKVKPYLTVENTTREKNEG